MTAIGTLAVPGAGASAPAHPDRGITRGPGEAELQAILDRAGIEYTRPEIDPKDEANFDFKALGVYIEVKKRTPGRRLPKQIRRTRRDASIICLFGPNAAQDLLRLSIALAGAVGAGND